MHQKYVRKIYFKIFCFIGQNRTPRSTDLSTKSVARSVHERNYAHNKLLGNSSTI